MGGSAERWEHRVMLPVGYGATGLLSLCTRVCTAAAGDASAAARLAAARDEWELCGGPESERTITNVLTGLGFRPEQFHTPCSAFSGGWQVRGGVRGSREKGDPGMDTRRQLRFCVCRKRDMDACVVADST